MTDLVIQSLAFDDLLNYSLMAPDAPLTEKGFCSSEQSLFPLAYKQPIHWRSANSIAKWSGKGEKTAWLAPVTNCTLFMRELEDELFIYYQLLAPTNQASIKGIK